jgi:hypothetical protein
MKTTAKHRQAVRLDLTKYSVGEVIDSGSRYFLDDLGTRRRRPRRLAVGIRRRDRRRSDACCASRCASKEEDRAKAIEEIAAACSRVQAMEEDLLTAIERGWNNGGTLVSFCSYCDGDIEAGVCKHHPGCLTVKYAPQLLARAK